MTNLESPLILEELNSKFEQLEEDLKKKKEVLESRIRQKEKDIWTPYIVGNLIVLILAFSTVIENLFYNTEQDWKKTLNGILQLFTVIISPVVNYRIIMNTIDEDNKIPF
ncbi:unnamed protein product [Caenorhabditis nigoni]